jgi:hypothetical protein
MFLHTKPKSSDLPRSRSFTLDKFAFQTSAASVEASRLLPCNIGQGNLTQASSIVTMPSKGLSGHGRAVSHTQVFSEHKNNLMGPVDFFFGDRVHSICRIGM